MNGSVAVQRFSVRKKHLSQPCLILIMGVAGSGKTTLAKELLQRLVLVYLDNNHIVDAFFPNVRSGSEYEKLRPCFYRALYTIVEENLKAGNSVLLDVPHVKEIQKSGWRAGIENMAARTESKLIIIRCLCSERVLEARIRARGEKRDLEKLSHWSEFLAQQPPDVAIPLPHLDIDMEEELSANVPRAIRYIAAQSAERIGQSRTASRAESRENSA
jgi:predicted kinase